MNYHGNHNKHNFPGSAGQPKKTAFPHPTRSNNHHKTPDAAALEEYKKAFMFFDANNDGYITVDELERAMNKCGVYPTKLELRVLMSQGDLDKNGVITFDEFVHLMSTQDTLPTKYTKEQLVEYFRLFDRDNDGFIERSEMVDIVRELRLGRFFPTSVIEQLFKEADVDGDGKISFQEFTTAVN
uniref:Calmodulin n=1 Tax=Panagrellus redivivus TaxID=6233 RepID=A0A7E4V9F7_PANRE